MLPGAQGSVLMAAAIMAAVVISVFTFSTGKRAAYIASAYGPGSLLGAWWLSTFGLQRRSWLVWVLLLFCGIALALMLYYRWHI